ncbi:MULTISPECIES: thiamine phosphate synthase [Microbacterium]|jgi:thiamine-phosphate diphosphorylase|uniref:thiamine phosphate synthase n=1 Tax=Microbacterium TaxID=33882 RepID=UPI0027859928|nr:MULTISPECIES: thiamine phosphate synthase [Microbacterium]MDF2918800.1 thiamine monophosphate synthase [Microbacterium sp.]MDQ1075343.1 thiamine-phosphate pyrophosphorylase [Microbacterium sp. SORGH_AS_0969]MDQ1115574.1 thiamine-phosphate pyrophosphorylase [Microbacterium testaceum]
MTDLSLHLVTDHRVAFSRLRDIVDESVDAGVTVVQLRDKVATGGELYARALDLADVIAGRCAFVVDDRLDIVLAARANGARVDGIHLGQNDLPVDVARTLLGPDALVGWTANTPAHLAAAAAFPDGTIDYLGVGVIRATATKPDHPRPLGVDGFAELAASTVLPCVAIGGIDVDDVGPLRRAGAAGVAVVSAVCAADDPGAVVRALRGAAA